MDTLIHEHKDRRFAARIGEGFTVCQVDEANDPGHCRIHPCVKRLPGGRLVLTTNIDGDLIGHDSRAYASDDGGATWRDYPEWPVTGASAGSVMRFAVLDDGTCLVVSNGSLYETAEKGVFHWGIRRSSDGGLTWGNLEKARVEFPIETDEPIDLYDPPQWFLDRKTGGVRGRDWLARWRKAQPSPAEREVRERFGGRSIDACITQLFPLRGSEVLAFLYLSPKWGAPAITVCLASPDAGRSWSYRSTPGPFDPRFAKHGYLRHALDGLCEPSCTRLASGELFLVMRLGSWHPLYTTVSADDGRTWKPQADQRPGCYYEGWPARPISVEGILPTVLTLPDGTLALCTGRPDVTLSFSFDNGYHWPCTHRFLEDNKPEEQGTYNNTMVQVAPNRLLLMYDHGGYHTRPPEFNGLRRVVGHFIDIETGD
jgi:hypothetical protein